MAQVVVMPKLGNTVETSLIVAWRVDVGEFVNEGDVLCEIETDKATLEVESSASGILLARFFEENDDVAILENLAVIGQAGESYAEFIPRQQSDSTDPQIREPNSTSVTTSAVDQTSQSINTTEISPGKVYISPRAKQLAARKYIDYKTLKGSGPEGRIIERDIANAIINQVKVSPLAQAMLDTGGFRVGTGSLDRKRITKNDLIRQTTIPNREPINEIPLRGVRKTIAKRMLESLQTTAQLTLNMSADATAIKAYRKRLKDSDNSLGLQSISINDLVMFAVIQSLEHFPELNALFENDTIYQYSDVHLGMAVDTPRGLIVPVIHNANTMRLQELSVTAKRLAVACRGETIKLDEMDGGTFTVTNLGRLGIESFTPVLNLPQVAILGVGSIILKPIEQNDKVTFIPKMNLSLTINHQVVDGAPGARFLSYLANAIANIDVLLAL